MARVGSFGRSRRNSGGNLTSLIASLLREQQAREDQNIFDAYKNGGEFQGKPVTDERILKYITDRRDSYSKDDPLYDQWNNTLIQSKFSIGEQKIVLKFNQGKVSAGAVASFYRQQLKNIPHDSAFYRDVAGRAAQWAKSAAAQARSAGRARATAVLNAKMKTYQDKIDAYSALEAQIDRAARQAGLIAGTQKLTDADASDLEAVIASSGIQINGHEITFGDWQRAAQNAYNALGGAVTTMDKAGRSTKTLRKQRSDFLNQTVVRINAIDDRAKYEEVRGTFEQDVSKLANDPDAIYERTKQYLSDLANIRDTALKSGGKNANDPDFIGGLNNEIRAGLTGQDSGPTPFDMFGGQQRGTSTSESDAHAFAADVTRNMTERAALASGAAYFGQDSPGGAFKVIPYPANAGTDPLGRKGLAEDSQVSVVNIDGKLRTVVLKGEPITASVLKDVATGAMIDPNTISPEELAARLNNGSIVSDETNTVAGYQFLNPVSNATIYAVKNKDGSLSFTTNNPFENGLTAGSNGLTTFTAAAEQQSGTDANGNPKFTAVADVASSVNLDPNASPFAVDPDADPRDLLKIIQAGVFGTGDDAQKFLANVTARANFQSGATVTGSGDLIRKQSGYQPPNAAQQIANFAANLGLLTNGQADALASLIPNIKVPRLPGVGGALRGSIIGQDTGDISHINIPNLDTLASNPFTNPAVTQAEASHDAAVKAQTQASSEDEAKFELNTTGIIATEQNNVISGGKVLI